ncbi:J domain-containing protein [Dokdonella sp.]|uniref:J domain-containing protein n=1 Tax=Dokdonella sp. TaxID=2291710 RepID=UPI0026284960|nr:J domain-containing protein [Dokdonella sp.]
MTNDTDFIALYQQLGCAPGDGVDAFRRAWRRRVAQLHPDRGGRDDTLELQQLNAAYAAAMHFHARYGRLPGETASGAMPAAGSRRAPPSGPEPSQRPHRMLWLLALPLLVLAAVWIGERQEPDEPMEPEAAAPEVPPRDTAAPLRLRLGMGRDAVLAMLGEPVSRNATLWQWGPSWVAFECGAVTDWYSSRLRPLKVATSVPTDTERRTVPRPRCAAASALPPGTPP